jgi:hypothetical protein
LRKYPALPKLSDEERRLERYAESKTMGNAGALLLLELLVDGELAD